MFQGGVNTSVRFGGTLHCLCVQIEMCLCVQGGHEHKCEVWRDLPVYVFR